MIYDYYYFIWGDNRKFLLPAIDLIFCWYADVERSWPITMRGSSIWISSDRPLNFSHDVFSRTYPHSPAVPCLTDIEDDHAIRFRRSLIWNEVAEDDEHFLLTSDLYGDLDEWHDTADDLEKAHSIRYRRRENAVETCDSSTVRSIYFQILLILYIILLRKLVRSVILQRMSYRRFFPPSAVWWRLKANFYKIGKINSYDSDRMY